MLNLEEAADIFPNYEFQEENLLKVFQFSAPLFFFTEFVYSFIPEIKLFQLDPGVYIFYLFLSLIYFFLFNFFFFSIPKRIEGERKQGTKTLAKQKSFLLIRFSLTFLFFFTFFSLNTIIPLSFDSFSNYSKETFDNRWSVDEVIFLARSLTQLAIFVSQLPVLGSLFITEEFSYHLLPFFWREITFFSFLIGGIFTPTVDAGTQSFFAFSTLGLYLLLLNSVGKREVVKLGEGNFLI